MEQKYDLSDEIPDEVIKEAFASADSVGFSARPFNYIGYRSIGIPGLLWWLPLTRVLPLIGITPQMLRPVFNPQRKVVKIKRQFPFNLSWLGLNKHQYQYKYKTVEVELPEHIESYEQLGGFPLTDKPFQELARILGKSVVVLREDGATNDHDPLCTVHPSGEIVEATRG